MKTKTSTWATANPMRPYLLPDKPGVYAFCVDRNHLYVGSTDNMRKRISSHNVRFSYGNEILTPWGACHEVTFRYSLCQSEGSWLAREFRLIRRLQPSLNCVGSVRTRRHSKRVGNVPTISVRDRSQCLVNVFATVEEYLRGDERRELA